MMASSIDPVALASSAILALTEERQRLRDEVVLLRQRESSAATAHARALETQSNHIMLLTRQIDSVQTALQAVTRLHVAVDDMRLSDEGAADDDQESVLELYELRRWKREFTAEQTRNLVHRVEELQSIITRLQLELDKNRSSCTCGQWTADAANRFGQQCGSPVTSPSSNPTQQL
jgi:hypothetical protein